MHQSKSVGHLNSHALKGSLIPDCRSQTCFERSKAHLLRLAQLPSLSRIKVRHGSFSTELSEDKGHAHAMARNSSATQYISSVDDMDWSPSRRM